MSHHRIRVIVAMHKSYTVPEDELYMPLHVGAALDPEKRIVDVGSLELSGDAVVADEIPGDDTGENISRKNPYYSELTGLYWAWKNLSVEEADAIGLAHYRRHFTVKSPAYIRRNGVQASLLTQKQAKRLFEEADIIVPRERNYYIESLYSHYAHTLDGVHLDMAREIVGESYPALLGDLEEVYGGRKGCMFNMMIMGRDELDEYCSFLFDVLGQLEERVGGKSYLKTLDPFEARLFGRVSEILFNVWLRDRERRGAVVRRIGHVSTEPVNWAKKGSAFLAAKFFGKKYGASF